jgi:hypothetical protein
MPAGEEDEGVGLQVVLSQGGQESAHGIIQSHQHRGDVASTRVRQVQRRRPVEQLGVA